MYIYYVLNKKNYSEKIISPFTLRRGLINSEFILMNKPVDEVEIPVEKCALYRILLDRNNRVLEKTRLATFELPTKENEFVILEDYRSFIVHTMNDRYEYCSYCDLIANKVMDNCHICHRKKCGSCEDFDDICGYCDTNVII
jgi:hypothetical protein